MQDLKNKIEAVLFMTGRAMTTEEIANFCNIGSIGAIQEALNALINDYTQRPSGLEIFFDEGKYRLNIKREYNSFSTRLMITKLTWRTRFFRKSRVICSAAIGGLLRITIWRTESKERWLKTHPVHLRSV